MGYPLTFSAMSVADVALGNAITDWTDQLGSWDDIVYEHLGLEPDDGRTNPGQSALPLPVQQQISRSFGDSRYPTSQSVITAIKARYKKDQPLNKLKLQKGPHSDKPLYNAGRLFYGDWESAVAQAGFDPKIIDPPPLPRIYPDGQSVIDGILYRQKQGLPLGHGELYNGETRDHTLANRAKEYFGSWDKALEAAGIDPTSVRQWQARNYTNKSKVIAAIRLRVKQKLPLTADAISHGKYSDPQIYRAAAKLFGGWSEALKAAKVKPAQMAGSPPPDLKMRADIIGRIKARNKQGKKLNPASLTKGVDRDSRLLTQARLEFGSWQEALIAAGIDPDQVYLRKRKYT